MHYPRGDHYCTFVLTGHSSLNWTAVICIPFTRHWSSSTICIFYCLWSWWCSEGLSSCFTALLNPAWVQQHKTWPIQARLSPLLFRSGGYKIHRFCMQTRKTKLTSTSWPSFCKVILWYSTEAWTGCERSIILYEVHRWNISSDNCAVMQHCKVLQCNPHIA